MDRAQATGSAGDLHRRAPRQGGTQDALLASRALLVKIKRDLENQVRGLLKNLGLVEPADLRITTRKLEDLTIEVANLLLDGLARLEQR